VNNLIDVFDERYYRHLNGGMLEAFGILFTRDLKIYVYPSKPTADDELMTTVNMPVHPRLRPLYDYLLNNKRLVDIESFDPNVLHIFSPEVLRMIRSGEAGWEEMVPPYVDTMIKENRLFGYRAAGETRSKAGKAGAKA
ncbi:MAG: TonB-dependent receptor, partial [Flavobacteriales bacterium]|nr:TonB-dependent receptor [Flavobacteriales bacterium]